LRRQTTFDSFAICTSRSTVINPETATMRKIRNPIAQGRDNVVTHRVLQQDIDKHDVEAAIRKGLRSSGWMESSGYSTCQ
jgi:hypothetical protein